MEIEIRNVTECNLDDIPGICKECLYWSFPEEFEKTKGAHPKHRAKKKQWIIQTLEEFGNCSKILYHNHVPVGYVECGPSRRFPQIKEHKSQRIGKMEDGVVFLSCLLIADKNLRGTGLGEKLLNSVITDLRKRGFKTVETYARRGSSNNPSGPAEFYLKRGFKIKDESNPEFPIVKLDL
ncbi:MAG: GNAT family N-acetyltransferase [Candidatus Bathyarchaeota archaeon]|nr:GNAT family N-acetyltransferase [Candidatus Bathyarchaeota archaeon]MDH5687834.1 GNAT family N-acetyltransferase [Candidatus Bathyarchaeota archaeon]